ncbi:MAG: hypothetical protein GQ582_05740, partial [Methyloprofundus sp.]|nr:hypothetical protein [Methyloprofundus sp.]
MLVSTAKIARVVLKELLAKIFQKKADKPWRVPENVRVYCVGDIHGRDDLLERIHHKIYLDSDGYMGDKVIIYLGDYIDRGSNSKAVIDIFLQKPLIGFKSVFLRGNHEQVLLDFMHK